MTGLAGAAAGVPGRPARRGVAAAGVCAALLAACSGRHPPRAAPVAPVTVASTTTTTIPPVTYTVKQGDTLGSIAQHFGVTVAALAAANHITDLDKIAQGQVLIIPRPPPPPSTTVPSTTIAPPASAAKLTVAPAGSPVGGVFTLNLTGAKPAEMITFEIDSPDGRKFTGQPHTASATGTVTATYLTTEQNVPGAYSVIATGSQGTSARASFRVDASGSTTTTSTQP
jgi:LysM repeat protein